MKEKSKELLELKQKADELTPFLKSYYKKNKRRLEKMDTIIHELHEKYTECIDCLECGNCCRTLGPAIYDKDIERIAKHLRIRPSEVVERYLRMDEDGDYIFRSMPCPFLCDDNYCLVYESRPKACREYPHTDRKRFYQIFNLSVKNVSTCPIAYGVMKELLNK